MTKPDTMTIAFPNGGILPRDITGGDERPVNAHDPVEVPRAYGEHLVSDRFAYETKPKRTSKAQNAAREKLEHQLSGLRSALEKAATQDAKDKINEKIKAAEKQLAELQAD